MLIYSFDYPPNDGGISRLCYELARQWGAAGGDTLVLTQASPAQESPRPPQVREIRTTAQRPRREWESFRTLVRQRSVPVICGIWYPEGLIATLARVRPRIILAHGTELMPRPSQWRRTLWSRLQRWTLASADLVIANSEYTRRLALRMVPESNVVAISLGVDVRRFSPGDRDAAKGRWGVAGKTVISTVARLHEYKGHDTVLEALAALPRHNLSQLVYLIAGRGPDRPRLEARAKTLGVESVVRWLGYVAEEELPALYLASDLFVLCTRESKHDVEGFGLAFLEAQACATPVIGTRTGGIPDAISEGQGGWLIEQDDARELGRMLAALVTDPAPFRRAGNEARARVVRECGWEHYGSRVQAAIRAVLPLSAHWDGNPTTAPKREIPDAI
jgi:phosphatidylinositol alpha-1,6-mannosyltransferase